MLNRTLLLAALIGLAACLVAAPARAADEDRNALTDQQFVTKASAASLAEVNLGNLAVRNAANADVKKFAQTMVDDHTKANQELNAIADKNRLIPAPREDDAHRMLGDRLARLSGANFDREYISAMVKDHDEAVPLFEREAKDGQNKELKEFASKTLPTLKHHREMVHKLAGNEKDGARDREATSTDKTKGADRDKQPASTDKEKDKNRDKENKDR
jgi:putative membrane protein